jgi:serine/threonine protein kinase
LAFVGFIPRARLLNRAIVREDQDLPEDVISALLGLLNTDGKDDTDFERGLAELCASHPRQAESIRRSAEEARRGLTRPGAGAAGPIAAGAPAPGSIRDARTGTRIGAFHLLERLGEGGMGTVYLAEQRIAGAAARRAQGHQARHGHQGVLARFEAERQALAMMNHSQHRQGVRGRRHARRQAVLRDGVRQGRPDHELLRREHALDRGAARAVPQVCSGVQHAHTKGVIHRDLTPNNMLVTTAGRARRPSKIIDFGLARATDHRLTEQTLFTERGVMARHAGVHVARAGRARRLDIDMRTDVYTLGVLLYELLAGQLAIRVEIAARPATTGCARSSANRIRRGPAPR